MKNEYLELKEKHQKEINDFPIVFAFNQEQLTEGLKKLNATISECCSVYGGGIIKKTDSERLKNMFLDHDIATTKAIKNDKTGEGYIRAMFQYELSNHEYSFTLDASDTLECLGLTVEDMAKSQPLRNGFVLAGGSYI